MYTNITPKVGWCDQVGSEVVTESRVVIWAALLQALQCAGRDAADNATAGRPVFTIRQWHRRWIFQNIPSPCCVAECGEMMRNIHPATCAATCRQGAGPRRRASSLRLSSNLRLCLPARFSDKFCPRHRNNPDKHRPGRGGLLLTWDNYNSFTRHREEEGEKYESNASTRTDGGEIRWCGLIYSDNLTIVSIYCAIIGLLTQSIFLIRWQNG